MIRVNIDYGCNFIIKNYYGYVSIVCALPYTTMREGK